MPVPEKFPAFVILSTAHPAFVADVAWTEDQAAMKLNRLKQAGDETFYVAANGSIIANEPTELEKLVKAFSEKVGGDLAAHEAIYDLMHRPPPEPPKPAPAPEPAVIPEPPAPPDCPFEIGNIVQCQHTGILAQVRVIIPAKPKGTLGMEVALLDQKDIHLVPSVSYPEFKLKWKSRDEAPKDIGDFDKPSLPPDAPVGEKPSGQLSPAGAKRVISTKGQKPKRERASLLKETKK